MNVSGFVLMNFCSMTWILLCCIGTPTISDNPDMTIPGRPDELFFLPERSGGENHLQYTTQQQLEKVRNSADLGPIDSDNDYQQYYQYVCEQEQIAQTKTWKEALTLTLF